MALGRRAVASAALAARDALARRAMGLVGARAAFAALARRWWAAFSLGRLG